MIRLALIVAVFCLGAAVPSGWRLPAAIAVVALLLLLPGGLAGDRSWSDRSGRWRPVLRWPWWSPVYVLAYWPASFILHVGENAVASLQRLPLALTLHPRRGRALTVSREPPVLRSGWSVAWAVGPIRRLRYTPETP